MNELWIVRHGETEWSRAHKHTSVSDLPLLEDGIAQARALSRRLAGRDFELVLSSPLLRARHTAELAGFDTTLEASLTEFQYGDYEGRTTAEIREERPGWDIWRDGCPGGETLADVAARLEPIVSRLQAIDGNALVFSHGHTLRVLVVCVLGHVELVAHLGAVDAGRLCLLLGDERGHPVIKLWNGRAEDA